MPCGEPAWLRTLCRVDLLVVDSRSKGGEAEVEGSSREPWDGKVRASVMIEVPRMTETEDRS